MYPHIVIRSPNDSAIPCVLLRIRTWPVIVPASVLSMLRLANASSPGEWISVVRNHQIKQMQVWYWPNKLRAYMFADKKSQSPDMAPSGVKHDILVDFMTCLRYSRGSLGHERVSLGNADARYIGHTRQLLRHLLCSPTQIPSTCSGTRRYSMSFRFK